MITAHGVDLALAEKKHFFPQVNLLFLYLLELVQWLRLLTLIPADGVQFLAKPAVFFHSLLKQGLITVLHVF